MGKHWFQKLNDKGASLIAVLVAISVVSIMGIVITQLTVTNIQMKEVERQAKTNFYDAEHVMDELTAGLNQIASDCMKNAYNTMLTSYRSYTADGSSANEAFARLYLANMIEAFNTTDTTYKTKVVSKTVDGKDVYTRGYYSISAVKGALQKSAEYAGVRPGVAGYVDYTAEEKDAFISIKSVDATSYPDAAVSLTGEPGFEVDFIKNEFILQGVSVSVKDKSGNMVTITTDIVFHTPNVDLKGSNLVKEFMRYSLIADDEILNTKQNVVVDGNVYAGKGGIHANGSSIGSFIGKKIVTRGDVTVEPNGTLTVGTFTDKTRTQLWVENVITKKGVAGASPAKVNLYGYLFVADDLEINGNKDEVKLAGEYRGYNFQENYDGKIVSLKDAKYSSAIVINGKKASIDMTNLNVLMIAGRTFVSRNAGASNENDIAMGESLAVRTNQIAYYVPINCINFTTKKIDDTMYQTYSGVPNVSSYLNSSQPYTEFNYRVGGAVEKVYYLNFASEKQSAKFYEAYFTQHKDMLKYYAENYLEANALKLSDDVVLQLQGDIIYREGATGNLGEFGPPDNIWEGWGYNKIFFRYASNHALTYKALQTNLEESTEGLSASDARIAEDATGMFDTLIDRAKLHELVTGPNKTAENKYEKEYMDAADNKKILAIVEGNYQVPEDYTGGLVIATGDVEVKAKNGVDGFYGTIISGGDITFGNNGATIGSDEILVSQLITNDIRETIPKFATIFKGYEESAEDAMSTTTISKYLTYDKWTKTYEE